MTVDEFACGFTVPVTNVAPAMVDDGGVVSTAEVLPASDAEDGSSARSCSGAGVSFVLGAGVSVGMGADVGLGAGIGVGMGVGVAVGVAPSSVGSDVVGSSVSSVTRVEVSAPPELLTDVDGPPFVAVVVEVEVAVPPVTDSVAGSWPRVGPAPCVLEASRDAELPASVASDPDDAPASGSAVATPVPTVAAHPTPRATASAPTRPT
ncbi:hypothetical protein [Mycolicibacterium lacusdiani]|uniref:hypothetical protein n=1 Tax=Mycolicibacterium lacusdiani TaxID=2895283 RepID=UPI001F24A44E|nr:hypothetical protein [Mycolicibacterium lacusdiani]